MGLASLTTKPGDLIVFVSRDSSPLVTWQNVDGTFRLIGDCYLYDCFPEELSGEQDGHVLVEFTLRWRW